MRKFTIVLAIFIMIMCLNKEDTIIIPKESIRFRVVANSNLKDDQELKNKLVEKLKKELTTVELSPETNIKSMRMIIKRQLPKFNETIKSTLKNRDYTISYGNNYFPRKEYKGIVYEEGEYESLVITIGSGEGKNFWCVLFPPLCLVDDDTSNYEYTTIVKEIINKYFYNA